VTLLSGRWLEPYYARASVMRKEEAITKNATSMTITVIISGLQFAWANAWGYLWHLPKRRLTLPLTKNRILTRQMHWLTVCPKSCYYLPCLVIADTLWTSNIPVPSILITQSFQVAMTSFIFSILRSVWAAC